MDRSSWIVRGAACCAGAQGVMQHSAAANKTGERIVAPAEVPAGSLPHARHTTADMQGDAARPTTSLGSRHANAAAASACARVRCGGCVSSVLPADVSPRAFAAGAQQ
ncbi:exported hypothetical protein [Xanthomonas phaseoli pv. phaseoli]|nr:exported hypothetical protein [Xanthomonas phaseoli pv. phaseoli]